MRLEDNMMPVLTGLVFAVVLGTIVQNGDELLKAFSKTDYVEASDDVFFVRAGTDAELDVLANDVVAGGASGTEIQILTGPLCGDVIPGPDSIAYLNSSSCEGPVQFTYCLDRGETCDAADVSMTVRPAPKNIADAYLPAKGGLVPLPLPSVTKNAENSGMSAQSAQSAPIKAFVVSLAPQVPSSTTYRNEMSRYLVDLEISDLKKIPTTDLSHFAKLRWVDVPLSAVRSARFLADHTNEASVAAPDISEPLIELESADTLKKAVTFEEETVEIELQAPQSLGAIDKG